MLLFLLAAQSVSCARLAPSVKSIEKNHLPANPRRGDFCIFFAKESNLLFQVLKKKQKGTGTLATVSRTPQRFFSNCEASPRCAS